MRGIALVMVARSVVDALGVHLVSSSFRSVRSL
jgi:hypothetical protein